MTRQNAMGYKVGSNVGYHRPCGSVTRGHLLIVSLRNQHGGMTYKAKCDKCGRIEAGEMDFTAFAGFLHV